MAQYGKSEYWDDRYTRDPEPFDWYQRWAALKEAVADYINKDHQILNVGAGNSRLSEEMHDDGYQNIVNIDISRVVTKQMEEKYRDKQGMSYVQMDARSIDYPDHSFDVVMDKGTLDSMLCGEGSTTNVQKMLSEIYRVLAPNGVYIIVSYGQPAHRLNHLDREDLLWKVTYTTVAKPTISTTAALASDDKDSPNVHYVYRCQKKGEIRHE
eukprot:GILJ01000718.1.p1 GENE.GILJ01000718.1~~GILJ01000718.1.p1  ORF type:complete len:211 (+),score=25.02 GILJ01000718.1:72-704(+)